LAAVAVDGELYALTCASDSATTTESLETHRLNLDIVVDSRVDQHICPHRSKFSKFRRIPDRTVKTSDGCTFRAIGKGDVRFNSPNGPGLKQVLLQDVIYAPKIPFMVISVNRLTKGKCFVLFENEVCTIKYPTGHVMATLSTSNWLNQELMTKFEPSIKLSSAKKPNESQNLAPKYTKRINAGSVIVGGVEQSLTTLRDNQITCVDGAKRPRGTSYNKGSNQSQMLREYPPIQGEIPHLVYWLRGRWEYPPTITAVELTLNPNPPKWMTCIMHLRALTETAASRHMSMTRLALLLNPILEIAQMIRYM